MSTASASAFTPERRRTLKAVVARILPGTHGPGAANTSVAIAFESAMQHRSLRGLRRGIEFLLDRLDAQANELQGTEFASCAPDRQDDLLRAFEQDPNPGMRFLFRAVIGYSLEGLFGDPVHGGNRDFRGWDAMGLRADVVRSGMCRGSLEA